MSTRSMHTTLVAAILVISSCLVAPAVLAVSYDPFTPIYFDVTVDPATGPYHIGDTVTFSLVARDVDWLGDPYPVYDYMQFSGWPIDGCDCDPADQPTWDSNGFYHATCPLTLTSLGSFTFTFGADDLPIYADDTPAQSVQRTIVVTDPTPPTTPVVTDEGPVQGNTTELRAVWQSSDPESGINHYEYVIATSTDTPENGWTDVGSGTSLGAQNLDLQVGQTYYVHVKATNNSGMSSVGRSDGIRISDLTRVYVRTDGSDENAGDSWQTAKRTITNALHVVQEYGQVRVGAGNYNEEIWVYYFRELYGGFPAEGGSWSTRNPQANKCRIGAVHLHAVPIIDGFEITRPESVPAGYPEYGIECDPECYAIIGNNEIHDWPGSGIRVWQFACPIIQSNNIYQTDTHGTDGQIFLDAFSDITVIRSNIIRGGSGSLNGVYCINQSGGPAGDGGGVYMVNNTILGHTNGAGFCVAQSGSSAYDVSNNIIAGNQTGILLPTSTAVTLDSHRNCVYGNTTNYNPSNLPQASDVHFNPGLDAENHLTSTSSCIDAGYAYNWGPCWAGDNPSDIDAADRIQGSAVDIGADEVPRGPDVVFVYGDADGSNNGTSWTDAFTSLQAGINAAAAASPKKQVWVAAAANPYEPIDLADGVAVYGGFTPAIYALARRNWQAHETVIDGGDQEGSVVTAEPGVTATAILDGFTITGGFGTLLDPNNGYLYGGGVYCNGASPVIANNLIIENGNDDTRNGGGIYCCDAAAPTIVNNRILHNSAGFGCAISTVEAHPVITNNTLVDNNTPASGTLSSVECVDSPSCVIANNIVTSSDLASGSVGITVLSGTQPVLYGNCVYGHRLDYDGYEINHDDDMTGADPLFVSDTDLHLQPNSPCIGKGWNSALSMPVSDMDGDARPAPQGGRVDVGADESQNYGWHLAVSADKQRLLTCRDTGTGCVDRVSTITALLTDDGGQAVAASTLVKFTFTDSSGEAVINPQWDYTDTSGTVGKAEATLWSPTGGWVTVKATVVDDEGRTIEGTTRVWFCDEDKGVDIFFCQDCTASMHGDGGQADHGAHASIVAFLNEMSSTYGIQFCVGGIKFNDPYPEITPLEACPDDSFETLNGAKTGRVFSPLAAFESLSGAISWTRNDYAPVGCDEPELQLDALHFAIHDLTDNSVAPHRYIVLITDTYYHQNERGSEVTLDHVEGDLTAISGPRPPVFISLWQGAYSAAYTSLVVNGGEFDPSGPVDADPDQMYPLNRLRAKIVADLGL